MLEISERVQHGLELLNDKDPLWFLQNFSNFDIGDCRLCILGKKYGNYYDGLDDLGIFEAGINYGFSVHVFDVPLELEEEWAKHINDLRNKYFKDPLVDMTQCSARTILIYDEMGYWKEIPYDTNS